jgi:hypothetical protein
MINLHPGQSQVFKDLFINKVCRYSVVVCSRGWGKSYLAAVSAMTAVYELMALDESVPNKNVYVIAPTHDQVTDIYYPIFAYDLHGESLASSPPSRDLGRFQFPRRVELRLVSFEAIERMRGKGSYFTVGDEISSWKRGVDPKEAWEAIVKPCIKTRWSKKNAERFGAKSPGRSLIISTPKGYNLLYDMHNYEEVDPQWKSYHFDYTTSPYLDVEEIEKEKHLMDPIKFASEYLAKFAESGNRVFYCFDRKIHVKELPYLEKDEDVHCAIDFNVSIQATSFFALRGNQMHFLDEIQGHPDTETLAKYISEKFRGHRVYAYPDPTGKARKSSAPVGQTDFSILRSYGLNVLARTKSPPIVDSVAAVNTKLKTAAGDIDMYFSPKCKSLIHSMERTQWLDKDIAVLDKTQNVEHFSDGVRYATEYLFPVRAGNKTTHRGFTF